MKIFLDTEFTNFHAPRLLSIGLVADDGSTFYAELENIDISACSEFVKGVVLPKLEKLPERVFDSLGLYSELTMWLAQFEYTKPVVCYDFDLDWELMVAALHMNVPSWLAHRNVFSRIDDLLKEQFFVDTGLPDHHALHDAQANQFAFRKACL
ncbi:MAG TPA: hypothetical protein VF450_17825 [Noviherbaspirillum sp.]